MPVIIIAGFLPMFFAAYAYRELNKVAPDCGTSFTWTTKAFGPYVGWLGGWAAIMATVIVLSNLAGVAVQFFYQFLGDVFDSDSISDLWENQGVNVVTCLVFLAIATWVAYRGITTTERVQIVLVLFQLAALFVFAVAAFAKAGDSPRGLSFDLDWFSPAGLTLSAFIAGLSGSIFAFWGWDTALTVNEESVDADKTPGRAALLCVLSILLTYLLVAIALQMYAGVGTEGNGLGNEDISDNVFGALAEPILGAAARPRAVPGRARLERGQPDHDVPADLTHDARDGHLPCVPEQVRDRPPRAQDAVLRDRRGRHRIRRVLRGADLPEREGAHRHDLLAGHHDLLLLRTHRVRVHLVLPQGAVQRRPEASCSSCSCPCWADWGWAGCSW